MGWNYQSPEEDANALVLTPIAPVAAPAGKAFDNAPLQPEEMRKMQGQLDAYGDHLAIQQQMALLITDNQRDPQFNALMREVSVAIDGVQSNPLYRPYGSPQLEPFLSLIRGVEQQKVQAAMVIENEQPQAAIAVPTIEKPVEVNVQVPRLHIEVSAERMPYLDMGSTTQALAAVGPGGFTPSNVPDVRAARGIERSGGLSA